MKLRRRAPALVLIMLLLLPCFTLGAAARNPISQGVGYVITTKLRLYSSPSTKSEVLDTASCGDCVVILREETDWCQVIFNLRKGYMRSDCLDVAPQRNAELGYGRINGSEVSLRSGPGTKYSILDFGRKGDTFYIVGIQDGWYQVLKDNATCFVRSDLLDLTEIPYENQASENEPQFYRLGEAFGELTYNRKLPPSAWEAALPAPSPALPF